MEQQSCSGRPLFCFAPGLEDGCSSGSPHTPAATDMVLGERNLVRDGKKRRLIGPWLRMSSSCVRTPPTPVESPTGTDLRTTHGASPPAPDWSFQSVCLYEGEIRRKDLGSQYRAELLPHPQRELWTPVTHNVFGMPCRRNTWLVNSFAFSKAVGSI